MPAGTDHPVTAYARDAVAGRVVAGRLVRLACARHLRDLDEGAARGLHFDAAAADHALEFFGWLRLAEGEFDGKPFELQPFQEFIVGSLFGWRGGDGHRRFRVAYVEMGKGNGKSPLAAGIGLYGLVADAEASAEVYSAATTRDQASILFRDAKHMAEASPALGKRLEVAQGVIHHHASRSLFKPVSSEHRGLDGKRVHMALIDEVHEHPSDLVVSKMRAGTKGRRQALIFMITNSGYDRHSVCWQEHDYSEQVLEGAVEDDSRFAYVCGLDCCAKCKAEGKRAPGEGCPDCDDWRNEAVWPKANPCLGVSITLKYLREQVREATGMPAREGIVKRLNFCVWTEGFARAIDLELWDAGSAPLEAEALRGRPCFGGLDLARVEDLTALVLVFPPLAADEPWKALAWFWVPQDDVRRRSTRDKVPYDVWLRAGLVKATEGNTTDFDVVRADLLALAGLYDLRGVAYDRTFAGEIVQALLAEGIAMEPWGQGHYSMGAPTAEMLRLVKARHLQHGGHPVLRWNARNLVLHTDAAGSVKPDKARCPERIDGMVALIMGVGLANLSPVTTDGGCELW